MLFSSKLSYLTVFSKLTMRITGWEYDCLLKVTGGLFRKRNIATFSQISWHPGNAYIMCVTCGFVPSVQKVIVGISPSPITTFIEGKDDDIVPTSQRKISVDIFSLSFYNVFTAGKTTTEGNHHGIVPTL